MSVGYEHATERLEIDELSLDMSIESLGERALARARDGWRRVGVAQTSDGGVVYEVWAKDDEPEAAPGLALVRD